MPTLLPSEITIVIYHSPCTDGFGSAFAAWKYFSVFHPDREIKFYPTNHGQPPPDLTDQKVLICDFSYPLPIIQDIIKKAAGLLIIDHHKTAEKDLALLAEEYKIFDMNQSGASLTWRYFFPDQPMPVMIQYIEDYDLWRKKLLGHEHFSAWFHTLPYQFEIYDRYLDEDLFYHHLKTKGPAYDQLNRYYIEKACDYAVLKSMRIGTLIGEKIENRYYLIAYLNTTILKSEIGARLLSKYPIDFSAVYSLSGDSTNFSLRSDDQHPDVSAIAKAHGGGGHRNAAGLSLPYLTNTLPGKIYPPIFEINSDYLDENLLDFDSERNLERDLLDHLQNSYPVVYYYAPHHSGKIGNYLLQDVEGKQKASDLLKNNCSYSIAIVWNYNPIQDETQFNLTFSANLPDSDRKEIFRLMEENLDIASSLTARKEILSSLGSTTITLPGLRKKL